MAKTNNRKVRRVEPQPALTPKQEYALKRRLACRQILKHRFMKEPIPHEIRNLDDLALTNRFRIAHVRDAMRRDGADLSELEHYIELEIPIE